MLSLLCEVGFIHLISGQTKFRMIKIFTWNHVSSKNWRWIWLISIWLWLHYWSSDQTRESTIEELICSFLLLQWLILVYNQKRPWCWEILTAGGKGDDRGWDSWMASLTRWTRVWASSWSWWWTRRPGILQSMGSQRVRHDWASALNQYVTNNNCFAHIRAATELWGGDTGGAVCRKFEERASFPRM